MLNEEDEYLKGCEKIVEDKFSKPETPHEAALSEYEAAMRWSITTYGAGTKDGYELLGWTGRGRYQDDSADACFVFEAEELEKDHATFAQKKKVEYAKSDLGCVETALIIFCAFCVIVTIMILGS